MLSYARNIVDSLACVHSIDNLIVEYVVKSVHKEKVLDDLAALFSSACQGWEREKKCKVDLPNCSKHQHFKSSIEGSGIYILYGHYHEWDEVHNEYTVLPLLRVKFNPNKWMNSPVFALLDSWISAWCDNGVLVKFDYAVDIPCRLRDIQVHSRKEPGLFKGTRYYGQRNKHGRLKIYDKKAESELDHDVTRVEWTFCYGRPLSFDDVYWLTCGPLPLPDASELGLQTYNTARLLLGIRSLGGNVEEFLSLYDRRTRKKLEPYTIGTGVQLFTGVTQLVSLLEYYCDALSVAFSCGGVNGFSIGSPLSRQSLDDLDGDELPF